MKVVIATGEPFAAGVIRALLQHGHRVCGVVTPPETLDGLSFFGFPAFLGLHLGYDLAGFCRRAQLPLRLSRNLSEGSLRHWIRNFQADGLLVVGWPRKIEDGVLALFPFGGVNIHPSVLPKLKGADPIFQVLFHGETGFGVTFHRLNQDLDGGNVLFQTALGVGLEDTYETLYFRFLQVVEKNVGVAMRVWQQCPGGFSQMGQTTRCDPFHPEQAMVHPYESAEDILRKARVFGFHLGVRITLGTHSFRFHRARFEDNGHSSVMQLCENRLQGLLLSTTNGRVWLKRMRHLSFRSRLSLRKGDLVSDPTVENQAMVDK